MEPATQGLEFLNQGLEFLNLGLEFLNLDDASEDDRALLNSLLFKSSVPSSSVGAKVSSDQGWETLEEESAEFDAAETYSDSTGYSSCEAPHANMPASGLASVPLQAPVLAPVPTSIMGSKEGSLPLPTQTPIPPAPIPVSVPEPVYNEDLAPDPTPGNHSHVPLMTYLPSPIMNISPVTTGTCGHVTTMYQIPPVMTPMPSVYVNNGIPSVPYPGYTPINPPPPFPTDISIQAAEQGVAENKPEGKRSDSDTKISTGPSKTNSDRGPQPRRNRKLKRPADYYNKSSVESSVPSGQECSVIDTVVTSRAGQSSVMQQEYRGNYVPQFHSPLHTPVTLGPPGYGPPPGHGPPPGPQYYQPAQNATGASIILPHVFNPNFVNYPVPPPQVQTQTVYPAHGVAVATTCGADPPHQLQYHHQEQPQQEYPSPPQPQPDHQAQNKPETEPKQQPQPLTESQSQNRAVSGSEISQNSAWEDDVSFSLETSNPVQGSDLSSAKNSEVPQVVNCKEKVETQSVNQIASDPCVTEGWESSPVVSVEQKLNQHFSPRNENSSGSSDSQTKENSNLKRENMDKNKGTSEIQFCQVEVSKSVSGVSKKELELRTVKEVPDHRPKIESSAAPVHLACEEKKSSPSSSATHQTNEASLLKQAGPEVALANPAVRRVKPNKSWSSLFKDPSLGNEVTKPVARLGPYTPVLNKKTEESEVVPKADYVPTPEEKINNDTKSCELGDYLAKYSQNHKSVLLQPRGLMNRSNWCYINATLQALLACPGFCNLMRSLPSNTNQKNDTSSTPITDSMIEFINKFEPMAEAAKPLRREKIIRKEDIKVGHPFEPTCVYKMLGNIKSDTFKVQGRQQDAEEFLTGLLNGLHDEILEMMKTVTERHRKQGLSNGDVTTNGDVMHHEEDEEEWQVMGRKNKGCVTRRADFSRTPISELFMGQMRSALYQTGGQTTANLQPFLTLQLDIQSEKITNVREALEGLVSREPLVGYTCSRTKLEVEASRQMTLEKLPPILILHFKRFVFDKSGDKSEGCQKILKKIEFSFDLEISKDLLSQNSKGKFNYKQRQYKLSAVVYHEGKEATKGHWIADVLHSGYGGWIRFDDNNVTAISEQQVQKHSPPRVPYLLYYRRGDTFFQPSQSSDRR